MKFLAELMILVGSRRASWLRPIGILLLAIAAVLLASRFVDIFFPRSQPDTVPPFSRDHYRQDGAFRSR
jgi:hypothetical protein